MKTTPAVGATLFAMAALWAPATPAPAQAPKPPAPNALMQIVPVSPNLEPAIPRPAQEQAAREKLAALEKRTGRKPNILVFLVDDLGYGDVGVYGGGVSVGSPTPHIDALARGGLRLTSTYSQPTCTPTRAAINTGRLPVRSGLTRPILTGDPIKKNPWADEVTAAKLLSDNGYRTAVVGKWHLGEAEGMKPVDVGYDEFFGFFMVVSEYSAYMDRRRYPELVTKPDRVKAFRSTGAIEDIVETRKGQPMKKVRPLETVDDIANCDQDFANYSADFIRRAAQDKTPFYLIHAFSKVHFDNWPAKGYQGKSPAGTPYRDAVVEVDDIVGRIMQTLKDTGQLENTLVFFTSDNGPNEDTCPDCAYTPFRRGKGTTWEGGVRVPGIAYWPGMIQAGRESDGLFDLLDLFNTSLAVGGIADKIPTDRYIDGIDQSAFLLADTGESKRQTVYMWVEYDFTALRFHEFKTHSKVLNVHNTFNDLSEATTERTGMAPWVYNLYSDPKEQLSRSTSQFEWVLIYLGKEGLRHAATFEKYPMKDIGLRKQ